MVVYEADEMATENRFLFLVIYLLTLVLYFCKNKKTMRNLEIILLRTYSLNLIFFYFHYSSFVCIFSRKKDKNLDQIVFFCRYMIMVCLFWLRNIFLSDLVNIEFQNFFKL